MAIGLSGQNKNNHSLMWSDLKQGYLMFSLCKTQHCECSQKCRAIYLSFIKLKFNWMEEGMYENIWRYHWVADDYQVSAYESKFHIREEPKEKRLDLVLESCIGFRCFTGAFSKYLSNVY